MHQNAFLLSLQIQNLCEGDFPTGGGATTLPYLIPTCSYMPFTSNLLLHAYYNIFSIYFKTFVEPRRFQVIERIHKWLPRNYSFVFVLIILTSLTLTKKFFWILSVLTRLVRMISIKAKQKNATSIKDFIAFRIWSTKMANFEIFAKGPPFALWPKLPILSTL